MKKELQKEQQVFYDKESDVLYFGVKKGLEEEYIEVAPGIHAELDAEGQVIGVEVLRASKVFHSIAPALLASANMKVRAA